MTLLYLKQSAHIIDLICESDVECRPHHSNFSEKQSLQYENRINRLASCIVLLAVVCKQPLKLTTKQFKINNILQRHKLISNLRQRFQCVLMFKQAWFSFKFCPLDLSVSEVFRFQKRESVEQTRLIIVNQEYFHCIAEITKNGYWLINNSERFFHSPTDRSRNHKDNDCYRGRHLGRDGDRQQKQNLETVSQR